MEVQVLTSCKQALYKLALGKDRCFAALGTAPASSVRGCLNQRCEGRRGTQMIRKVADELLHGRVPEAVETEEIHLTHRLLRRPFVHRHAVGGDKHARAVVPKEAMHEDPLFRIITKQ